MEAKGLNGFEAQVQSLLTIIFGSIEDTEIIFEGRPY